MPRCKAVAAVVSMATLAMSNLVTSTIPPFMPIYYSYGGYPRVMSNISYGTPCQDPVPAVVDLGSADFWVDQQGSILNYGCNSGILCTGPCNISVAPSYNYRASKTATEAMPLYQLYSYGGNGKFVFTNGSVNDTLNFGDNVPALINRRVALANFTILQLSAEPNCPASGAPEYDRSILGLSSPYNPTVQASAPYFRRDLLDTGAIASSSMSMWFDRGNGQANQTYHGTVLFGALPDSSKYQGVLTKVPLSPPKGAYVGYYLPVPKISVINVHTNKTASLSPGTSKQCLLDSGTGDDYLPVDQEAFLKAAGLIIFNGYPAFDGPCNLIPPDAHIAMTFTGSTKGETVTIRVPLLNYARGNSDYKGNKNKCALSMQLGKDYDCIIAAPSIPSYFLAVDDDTKEIAIAQGGRSVGALEGVAGLGPLRVIGKGQGLPAV